MQPPTAKSKKQQHHRAESGNPPKLPDQNDKSLQTCSKSIQPDDKSSHKQKPVAKGKKRQLSVESKAIQPG